MGSRRVIGCARSCPGRRFAAIILSLLLTVTSLPLLGGTVVAASPEMDWTDVQTPVLASSTMAYDAATDQLILFGGTDAAGVDRADTWVRDGNVWTSVHPATSPTARHDGSMAYDALTGKVVLFGGSGAGGDLGDTWEWDGTSWTDMTPTSPAASPPARFAANMAYDGSTEKVMLFGGFGPSGYLDDTWEWDGTSWTDVTPASPALSPSPREYATMAYDAQTSRVILFGGQHASVDLADTWSWDGTNWTLVTPASPAVSPSARFGASMAYDEATEQIILFGGIDANGRKGDTWAWDGIGWSEVTPAAPAISPSERFLATMAYDASSAQVILFGGTNASGTLGDTWAWDGTSWTNVASGAIPSPRFSANMAYDATRQQVVLFGGVDASGYQADTWVWDGNRWSNATPMSPAVSPSNRQNASMVYDASTGTVVLFGGFGDTGMLADTWEWDGTNWTNVTPAAPAVSPGPREYASMAYDAATGTVVLFGGYDAANRLGDTWTWDGANWTKVTPTPPAPSPSARDSASMTYDGARQQVVLFGGYGTNGLLNDTWAWDGSNWTAINPTTSPSARDGASMTYDSLTQQVILFGGSAGTTFLNDTWTWDGASWTQLVLAHQPSARSLASMAYDAMSEQVVLFGGNNAGIRYGDTWLLQETDRIPPSTSARAVTADSAPYTFGNWTNQAVTVTLDALDNDGGSGVAETYYTIDGGNQLTYGDSISITTAGDHVLTFWSVDNAYHPETAQTVHVKIDLTNPTTNASATTADGAAYTFGSWTKQAVTVTLNASDDTDASGLADTFYTVDSDPQQTYSAAFTVSGDGDHVITYWSTDHAGNAETPQEVHVEIDTVAPTVTYAGNAGNYTVDQTVDITCTPADALSGVASSTCADITGRAGSFALGINTFSASATDNAGNVGSGSVSFTVGVTPASLCQLTEQLESNRRAESQLCAPLRFIEAFGGMPNSRLKSSFVNAYIMLVNMQRDLSRQEKAELISFARAL